MVRDTNMVEIRYSKMLGMMPSKAKDRAKRVSKRVPNTLLRKRRHSHVAKIPSKVNMTTMVPTFSPNKSAYWLWKSELLRVANASPTSKAVPNTMVPIRKRLRCLFIMHDEPFRQETGLFESTFKCVFKQIPWFKSPLLVGTQT